MGRQRRGNSSGSSLSVCATKERQFHNGGIASEIISERSEGRIYIRRQRATAECLLDYYFGQRRLDEHEREAGLKFRKAYQRYVLGIRVDDPTASGFRDAEMASILPLESERILREAYAVLSPAQKAMIITVCGHDEWAMTTRKFETFRRGLAVLIKLWRAA